MAERSAPRTAPASSKAASKGAKQRVQDVVAPSRDPAAEPSTRSRLSASPKPRVRIIAVANQKGGVGKSTTAVSLGAALAELGKKVLVIDLDPQGNASTGLGIRHESREVTVYDVLAAQASIEGAIVPTPIPGLFAIPSTIDLAGAEIELVSQFSRELRLRKALEPLNEGDTEFILLDCPPSLGLLTVNALAAAEELIVPIQCEYYALEGLGQLLKNVRLVQQNVNPKLRLTGIVMTMFDPRTKLSEQVVNEVRRFFGDRVYDTIIPRTVRLSEAPGFGQPITVYDSKSRGAQSYRDLAREVASKLPSDAPLPVIEELPAVVVDAVDSAPVRAPRPLVEAEPEPEPELDATPDIGPTADIADLGGDEPEGGRPAELPTVEETSVESEGEVEGSRTSLETRAVGSGVTFDGESGLADSPPAVEVEPASPSGEREEPTTKAAPPVQARTEQTDREPARDEPGRPQVGAEGRRSGVVVITEGREDEGDGPDPEAEDDGGGAESPKRRWRLFRRRGNR